MSTTPRISLNNLSFQLEQSTVKFEMITLSFEKLKYGIVGPNGVGKSTFLKLLLGQLSPDTGSIQRSGTIINVPQLHTMHTENETISGVLGTTDIIQALQRINNGSLDESDFEKVAGYWDIEKRIEQALSVFELWPIDLNKNFLLLSGGKKTKVLLAKTILFPSDFLIFDEPTNNLDINTRNILYQYIKNSTKGIIVVSHDRTLLNLLDRILEINTKNIEAYGGNYDFYKEQKELNKQALQHEIHARTEALNRSKQTIQTRMERHQQNEAQGRKRKTSQIKAKGNYNKTEIKSKKGKSENTNQRIRLQAGRMLETVEKELEQAKEKFEVQEELNISLTATSVPSTKTILHIENLSFNYTDTDDPLIKNFELQLIGPERIAITGANGSGKSTLVRLIKGELIPRAGKITLGLHSIAYLDQTVSFLDPNLSIIDNFLNLNPESKPFDAYSALATFKFRNKNAEKLVRSLSSGEKMRAGLAVSLMSLPPPQLIILDEPTNHLDLESIEAIEEMLVFYQGAILAISHNETFLQNINISRTIHLKSVCLPLHKAEF